MIPPQEIQRAVQLFEQTWRDVVRLNYTSRAAHARMQQDIDRRFSEYHQQSKAFAEQMKAATAKIMQQAMGMTGAVMQQMKAVQSNLPVSAVRTPWRQTSLANLHRQEKEYQDFQLRVQQLQKQEEVLNQEQERLEDALVMLADSLGDILTIPKAQRSEMYFPEAAAAWDDYTISDPYALCFAFLYLLDQGSDLPWAYPISLPLMEQCASVLPNAQLIRQADTIWIQANALSHAFFYKIITEARKYDIPVRYFSFASAEKCAEQLALADMG